MYINIESIMEVVHKLLSACLRMLWITPIGAVDNLVFVGCGYLGFELWITILIGVCFRVMDIPTLLSMGLCKKSIAFLAFFDLDNRF